MIDYQMAAPLILGTYFGSTAGAILSKKIDARTIKLILVGVIFYSAISLGIKYI
jgi:uncharacterized membrane protein YfcA